MSCILNCCKPCLTDTYTRETDIQIVFSNDVINPGFAGEGSSRNVSTSLPIDQLIFTPASGAEAIMSVQCFKQQGCCRQIGSSSAEFDARKMTVQTMDVDYVDNGMAAPATRHISEKIKVPVRGIKNILARIFCCM